jgi:hypothetical protein
MPSSLIINRAVSTPQYSLYTTGDKIKPLHDMESIGSDVDDFRILITLTCIFNICYNVVKCWLCGVWAL